eukprot:c22730_g1_i1 orf=129-560(+)
MSASPPAASCEELYSRVDNDKEVALASALALQPNFMSQSVSKEQIAKLQALRYRRLQLKHNKAFMEKKESQDMKGVKRLKVNDSISCSKSNVKTSTTLLKDGDSKHLELNRKEVEKSYHPRKRSHKLRWGLEIKERWERKGNM